MDPIWLNFCCRKATKCTVWFEDRLRSTLAESSISTPIQSPTMVWYQKMILKFYDHYTNIKNQLIWKNTETIWQFCKVTSFDKTSKIKGKTILHSNCLLFIYNQSLLLAFSKYDIRICFVIIESSDHLLFKQLEQFFVLEAFLFKKNWGATKKIDFMMWISLYSWWKIFHRS